MCANQRHRASGSDRRKDKVEPACPSGLDKKPWEKQQADHARNAAENEITNSRQGGARRRTPKGFADTPYAKLEQTSPTI